MTEKDQPEKDYSTVLVSHWIDKARNDLESAQGNFQSGRLANAVRDIYFACFHVVSALFMPDWLSLLNRRLKPFMEVAGRTPLCENLAVGISVQTVLTT